MMRGKQGILLFCSLLCLTGCGIKTKDPDCGTPLTSVIPADYFEFIGSTAKEQAEDLKPYGSAKVLENGDLEIITTKDRQEQVIRLHQEEADEIIDRFLAADEDYTYLYVGVDNSYTFGYSPDIDPMLQAQVLYMVPALHTFDTMLTTGNPFWQIHIKVVNCETGDTVAEATLPEETLTFTAEDWQ